MGMTGSVQQKLILFAENAQALRHGFFLAQPTDQTPGSAANRGAARPGAYEPAVTRARAFWAFLCIILKGLPRL
jgi:hypothetical protein